MGTFQRCLRLIHQAVPAPHRAGFFILHKVNACAVQQIACHQERDAGVIHRRLLLALRLAVLDLLLRVAKQ